MTRLVAVSAALVACGVPLLTAPRTVVVVAGLLALALALAGVATLWRPPVVVAACLWMADYAFALVLADTPPRVVTAVGFGLALLLMLEHVELGRGARRAQVVPGVARSFILAWVGFALATAATALLALTLAGGLVGSIPLASAPFLAAAAFLGVVLALAWTVRRNRRSHEAQ